MKKILITGANSYIGTSFENYIREKALHYSVDTVDMQDEMWYKKSFAGYDSVFHVAGIAHADIGKISDAQKSLYYKINCDLAVETAKKAMADGVRQFIYMSSAIVYGESAPIGKNKIISAESRPQPANFYGDSKLRAEKSLLQLESDKFRVVILRPPMIYGSGSKGNYPILSKLAQKLPAFPYVKNQRSMLYIENLCEFIRLMIQNEEAGIFHPQNAEYSNTSQIVKMIAGSHGKQILVLRGWGWILRLLSPFTGLVNKAFGSFCYDLSLSEYKEDYRIYSLKESIERTEK